LGKTLYTQNGIPNWLREVMNQLGVSKVDDRNRTYLPEIVIKALKIEGGNHWLSWEQDNNGQIIVFKGSLRVARKNNNKLKGGK